MELKFQVQAKIARPRDEVFDAVYSPEKLNRYFTTAGPGLYPGKDLRRGLASDPAGSQRLLRQLPRLDEHAVLSQGLAGARHQPARRLLRLNPALVRG